MASLECGPVDYFVEVVSDRPNLFFAPSDAKAVRSYLFTEKLASLGIQKRPIIALK